MKYKSIVFIAILLVSTIFLITCNESKIEFVDPGLEQAIREAIDKPSGGIYDSELKELKELKAAGWDIKSLKGIVLCTSLEVLRLSNNKINDLSPLARIQTLKLLIYGNNPLNQESKNSIIPLLRENGVDVRY